MVRLPPPRTASTKYSLSAFSSIIFPRATERPGARWRRVADKITRETFCRSAYESGDGGGADADSFRAQALDDCAPDSGRRDCAHDARRQVFAGAPGTCSDSFG